MMGHGERPKIKIKRLLGVRLFLVACLLPFVFAEDGFWQIARPDYQFEFPRDAASHPDYRIEQWAYAGHVSAADGHRFAYQFRFIRAGVDFKPRNPSRWAVRDLFVTQLAVTDIDGRQFKTAERINRAGVGWAGAAREDFHLWNDDWEARQDNAATTLRAVETSEGIGFELTLEPDKPVAHGEEGVFQKGFLAFNASHFYSQPRRGTRGALWLNGRRIEVSGTSWMDHEFGSSLLEEGQAGWDHFSIELDDGSGLKIYQIRLKDGSRDEYSIATLLRADGSHESFKADQFTLEPLARWTSPASGGSYPVHWRVKIPSHQIELDVRAVVDNQELQAAQSLGVTYWNGVVEVAGTRASQPVRGRGFLEMNGYANSPTGALSE